MIQYKQCPYTYKYHILIQRLKAAAEHLSTTSVLQHSHALALVNLPDPAGSVQRPGHDQVISRVPLQVHHARLVALQAVNGRSRTGNNLTDYERAIQGAGSQQTLVIIGELEPGHCGLVVVEDMVQTGEFGLVTRGLGLAETCETRAARVDGGHWLVLHGRVQGRAAR